MQYRIRRCPYKIKVMIHHITSSITNRANRLNYLKSHITKLPPLLHHPLSHHLHNRYSMRLNKYLGYSNSKGSLRHICNNREVYHRRKIFKVRLQKSTNSRPQPKLGRWEWV